MKDLNTQFIEEISKIKEPEVFIGVARLLRVKLVEDEKDENDHFIARDFYDVCADSIVSFGNLDRKKKRELLKVLKKSNKEGEVNASRTKDTESAVSD